jgi:hypothetical protein
VAYTFTQWNNQVAENIRELCGDAFRLVNTKPLTEEYLEAYQVGVTVREIAQQTIRLARAYAAN